MKETRFRAQHVWAISVLLMCAATQIALYPTSTDAILSILPLAYIRSVASAMRSRSLNRSSNWYHLISAVLSVTTFFLTFKLLITDELTWFLLLPYIAGSVAGRVSGVQISTWVEKKIGAVADIVKDPLTDRRNISKWVWPVALPMMALTVYLFSMDPQNAKASFIIAFLLFADGFSHVLSSRSGNRDKPAFITATNLFSGVAAFLIYQQLIAYNIEWSLFIPYTAGYALGSILGTLVSMRIEKGTKASVDTLITAAERPKLVILPIVVLAGLVTLELLAVPSSSVVPLLALYGLATVQNVSFMVVSRAGNRDNVFYHVIAAIFSNGVWFLTLKKLYLENLEWPFIIPFAMGGTSGNLLAYNISVQIEYRIGARADAPAPQKQN